MELKQFYYYAKKIHQWTMWLAIALGVPLAISGVVIEGDSGWRDVFNIEQLTTMRSIHRLISTKFALVLAVMMTSGFLMWLLPKIIAQRLQRKNDIVE